MPTIAALTSFTANTQAKASEVNANFSTIRTTVNTFAAFIDSTATITGVWTFSTAPVFSTAQTFAAGVTITTGGLAVTAGASTFGANVTVTGTVAATLFSGSGASLTALPAANLTGALPAISGAALTGISASNITTGTLPSAQLPATITAATTFSAGGLAVVITNQGAIRFTASAGVAGSQPAFAFDTDYVKTGASTPPAMTNAPAGTSWKWVRVTNAAGAETGYIPMVL